MEGKVADANSIEYLNLEITSSTKEAVAALDELTASLGKLIERTGDLSQATSRVATFGRSLDNLAKGLRNTISASKEITFGGAERSVRQLDSAVRKLANNTLSEFGIKNRKAASYYRKSLSDLSNEWLANGGVSQTKDLSERFNQKLPEVLSKYSTFQKSSEDIMGVMDVVETYFNKKKFSFEYGLNDLSNEAKEVFGKILEPGNGNLPDVAEAIGQIEEKYGNAFFEAGAKTDEALDQIAKKYLEVKGAAMDYWEAVNTPKEKGGLGGITSRDALMRDVDAIREAVKEARNFKIGDAYNNSFNAIAEASKTLEGVDASNMTNIIGAINQVGNLDTKAIADAAKAFTQLGNSLGKINLPEGGSNVGEFIQSLYVPLKVFEDMRLPDFKPLFTLQKALSGFNSESYTIAATNLTSIVPVVKDFAAQMQGIEFKGVESLGNAIKTIAKIGHANIQKSIENMPKLTTALKALVDELNGLPEVNDKTLRLVEALGQLKIKGANAGEELKKASGGLNLFGNAAKKTHSHTHGLVGVLIKARAVIYALRRAFDALKGSINLASDLIEIQNVVDVTFGDYSNRIQDITSNAIEAYGTSEITFKSIASQFQAMGSAMGIGNAQVQSATQRLKEMGVAYGETTGRMGDMATTLTELSADMASFYNKDIEDVRTAMTAIYTGQTRPLKVAA